MAESARLLFSRGKDKAIGNIIVNAFVSENHIRSSQVTRYPIETGSEISDHIINEPIQLAINALIENDGDGSNILDSYGQLNELMDNKILVTVVTGLKVYENMHISSLTIPRTVKNGGSLQFDINLTEVKTVDSQSVAIPISQLGGDTTTQEQSQPEQDLGKGTSGQTQVTEETNFLEQIELEIDEIFNFFDQ